ncbi:MAG: sulfotransferase [Acetobacteraceae bacterium]|nr:sulfotransferase [Acetobacteraceae bacterium]
MSVVAALPAALRLDRIAAAAPPRRFPLKDAIFILGAPRSGTTWLATVFDSHPGTLYRHEPDIVDRGPALPGPCRREDIPLHRDAARDYLGRLAGLATLKTAGHPWLFRKNYRSEWAGCVRLGKIGALHALAPLWNGAARAAVKDRIRDGADVRVVIKSVSGCGRAGLYAEAAPEACFLFVMRNPFGQIASMLRGTRLGKLNGNAAVEGLWHWPEAAQHGLTEAAFARMTLVDKLAWHWVLHCEKALADLRSHRRARIACYEAMCAEPVAYAASLFAFAGLGMGEETRAFLRLSTESETQRGYYSLRKSPSETRLRWRTELSRHQQDRIARIVEGTEPYRVLRAREADGTGGEFASGRAGKIAARAA